MFEVVLKFPILTEVVFIIGVVEVVILVSFHFSLPSQNTLGIFRNPLHDYIVCSVLFLCGKRFFESESRMKKKFNPVHIMYLQTKNHKFYVKYEVFGEHTNEMYFYSIGNPKLKPKPCVVISVVQMNGKWIMAIQELEYYSTCSSRTLERKTGTIEMLQGSIKAVLKRHPNISVIELNDKSFFTLQNGDHIPLPEYRLLTKKKTWYEEHFGAIPAYEGLERILESYKNVNTNIDVSTLTRNKFKKLLIQLHLREVSGNGWMIPIKEVDSYQTRGVFKTDKVVDGGSGWIFDKMTPIDHIFRIYGNT